MIFLILLGAYVIGSIPTGYLIVRVASKQDLRRVGNGRTGGTNAMRAAGVGAGLLTTLIDGLKGAACVWLAQWILPASTEATGIVVAGLAAMAGHNYSVFMRFKGGPGAAPAVGAAMAIWPWSIFIAVPVGLGLLFGLGYASVATLAMAVAITLLFAFRAYFQSAPSEFVLFGIGSFLLLAWALRWNIARLVQGQERLIGWRARRLKQSATADFMRKVL